MPRLLDHFSSVISEGLDLSTTLSSGDGRFDAASVRSRLLSGVQAAQAAARREVRPEQDLQLATQAVVAWLDEVMLGCPDWGAAIANLQGEILGTQIARETFFNYLEELDDSQDEVREVYYVLLCLGFRGFYGELSNGREELERLKDLHGRRLDLVPASAAALVEQRLMAQPYGVEPPPPLPRPKPRPKPPPEPRPAPAPPPMPPPPPRMPPVQPVQRQPMERTRRRRPKKRRLGLILGLLLLSLALLFGAGFLLLPGWLQQQIEGQVATLECADIDVSLGRDRVVRLNGYVASETDRQRLLTGLDQIFGLAGTKDNIAVYPWPFCEALTIVKPYFDRNVQKGLNLAMGVTAHNSVLMDGDPLVLTIRPPNYPAYLYVDYYQQNGDIGHVAHADANDPPDAANDEFDYPTGFEGAPPYGLELLTIFASPKPLFLEPLPKFEKAAAYFPVLRRRLSDLAKDPDGASIAAALVFIRTEP